MIPLEKIGKNAARITLPKVLNAEDFNALAPQADALIKQHRKIRLLVDATGFDGWENIDALERHMGFVKARHEHVERVAIIAGHRWQHWLAGAMRAFLHPDIHVFERQEEDRATEWLMNGKQSDVAA